MEYAYMVAGAVAYFLVAGWEWGAAAAENSKTPFLHAALWPLWLLMWLAALGIAAAIAAIWLIATFFSEMYKASKWSKGEE